MSGGDLKRRRSLMQRLGVRWPRLAQRMTAGVMRLPVGSRLRRATLLRAARDGFDAWNRSDLAAASFLDDPEIETHVEHSSGVRIDFDPVYHGVEGHCRVMEIVNEAWKNWRGEITDVVEVDSARILGVGHFVVEGRASGVELDMWSAALYVFRRGKLVYLDSMWDVSKDRVLEAFTQKGIDVAGARGVDRFRTNGAG